MLALPVSLSQPVERWRSNTTPCKRRLASLEDHIVNRHASFLYTPSMLVRTNA